MGLQRSTIRKLLRDDFSGTKPLIVDPAEREKLGAEINARLQQFAYVDTKEHGWLAEEKKLQLVASFSVIDPEPYYYGGRDSFRLLLDDINRLTIKDTRTGDSALINNVDEIIQFVRHYKQRLERKRALKAKRGKVRELHAQAILAQVKKLAKEERFDFMSETDSQKLRLYVRLSDEHAIELSIPFRDFKQILPQLRSAIASLRQFFERGIRFHIVGRRALPWRKTWITHQSLGADGPSEAERKPAESSEDGHPH